MSVMPSQYRLLTNAMQFAQENHKVISQNVANVNTPGYQTQELSFDEHLVSAENLENMNTDFQIQTKSGLTARLDGNNVDLDQEVANLKRNAMIFQAMSQILASKMTTMEKAMSR